MIRALVRVKRRRSSHGLATPSMRFTGCTKLAENDTLYHIGGSDPLGEGAVG
jgi:hypothetical protein